MPSDAPSGDCRWPAAVLWDLDGTLVDTEHYWWDAEKELVAAYGGQWTDADAAALVGCALLDSAAVMRAKAGLPLSEPDIVDALLAGVIRRIREHLPFRPGVRELLTELRADGVPLALVTMSWTDLAAAVLESLPPGTFDVVVTGDQVQRGKPHPEPYLTAAARLGLPLGDCLAIEDSTNGMLSAHAAGATTLVVPNVVEPEPLPGVTVLPTLDGVTLAELRRVMDQPVGRNSTQRL
ncbi:MAG: HAD family phosphatase [Austwickia sp.]|jgi:HAD superfamily hydrolase (TIGR01509 family)|nr:HAD family phosphatase [Austwickia sp.]MBK9101143.1 HAD family phosphatase [Austwickia sp.]